MNHFAESFKRIRRSPYQALAAVMVLAQTFFLAYLFVSLTLASDVILRHFETQPQITAFFVPETDPSIVDQAASLLRQREYVKEVKVVSNQEALQIYQNENKDDPLLLQLVTADILPASMEVSTTNVSFLPALQLELAEVEQIDEVVFHQDIVEKLTTWTNSIRLISLGLVIIMGITSIVQIAVITGMKVSARRYAIRTMRLLGATKWYVQAPFIFEGVFYGVLGALIGWLIVCTILLYLTPWMLSFLGDIPILPVPYWILAAGLGIGSLIGAFLGALTSYFASYRFLK